MQRLHVRLGKTALCHACLVCHDNNDISFVQGGPAKVKYGGLEYNMLGLVGIFAVFVDNAVPVKEKRFFLLAHAIIFL
jgi:hypothetical protein